MWLGIYETTILAWFGNVYDDPMFELKNLKYETTAREYEDAFDSLLSRVEVSDEHVVSLLMGGLLTEIEMRSSRFKASTSTFNKPLLTTPNAPISTVSAKPNTPAVVQNRRLSQKEYAEKRANNFCFYCDQKYVPGHKYSGQLYSLVLIPDMESEGEFLEEDETMVVGTVGKNTIHILIDYGSTHNFLDKNMAKQLGCDIRNTCPLAVTVVDGNNLVTDSECKQFKWQFGPHSFTTDVMLLPLGGCDMVLGIQ
ncbi:reverse transcriptase [Tanacetum coccineum]